MTNSGTNITLAHRGFGTLEGKLDEIITGWKNDIKAADFTPSPSRDLVLKTIEVRTNAVCLFFQHQLDTPAGLHCSLLFDVHCLFCVFSKVLSYRLNLAGLPLPYHLFL